MDFKGKVITSIRKEGLIIPANKLFNVFTSQKPLIKPADTAGNVLVVRLVQQGKATISKPLYFCTPKNLNLPKAELIPLITVVKDGFSVQLKSATLAKNVWLRLKESEGFFEDNYFDLIPGKQKTIVCKTQMTLEDFKQKLVISSLVDSY
jgi:beta-mannosidase